MLPPKFERPHACVDRSHPCNCKYRCARKPPYEDTPPAGWHEDPCGVLRHDSEDPLQVYHSRAYAAVKAFYGDRKAERSQVPLMNHIDEGLRILQHLKADYVTECAWCWHPMFQSDADLLVVADSWGSLPPPMEILLVMEYRNQANAWLSDKVSRVPGMPVQVHGDPSPGPLPQVQLMLVADKVQNYLDFFTYHRTTHDRSAELEVYFHRWFQALGVSPARLMSLGQAINSHAGEQK